MESKNTDSSHREPIRFFSEKIRYEFSSPERFHAERFYLSLVRPIREPGGEGPDSLGTLPTTSFAETYSSDRARTNRIMEDSTGKGPYIAIREGEIDRTFDDNGRISELSRDNLAPALRERADEVIQNMKELMATDFHVKVEYPGKTENLASLGTDSALARAFDLATGLKLSERNISNIAEYVSARLTKSEGMSVDM